MSLGRNKNVRARNGPGWRGGDGKRREDVGGGVEEGRRRWRCWNRVRDRAIMGSILAEGQTVRIYGIIALDAGRGGRDTVIMNASAAIYAQVCIP